MKIRYFLLIICIVYFSNAQEFDRGFISLTVDGITVDVPVQKVVYTETDGIIVNAVGRITEPSYALCMFTLTLSRLTSDPRDLCLEKCWLSVEYLDTSPDVLYLSFGFQHPDAFYSSQNESRTMKIMRSNKTDLRISNIAIQKGTITIAGTFSGSFFYLGETGICHLNIQKGNFHITCGEPITRVAAFEDKTIPTLSDYGILPSQNISAEPAEYTAPFEEESYTDTQVISPEQDSSTSNSTAPQQKQIRGTTRIDRTTPSEIKGSRNPHAPPGNNSGTRTSGFRR